MAMTLPHLIGGISWKFVAADSADPKRRTAVCRVIRSAATSLRWAALKQGLSRAQIYRRSSSPSLPLSPRIGRIRPDLLAACQALMDAPPMMAEVENEAVVREYRERRGAQDKSKGVPVFVMMPLDSVTTANTINRRKAMNASLQALKSAGVEGVLESLAPSM